MRVRPLIIPVFILHQGCPHRCVFCNQRAIVAHTRRPQPTAAALHTHIAERLKGAASTRKPIQIAFYGGNFLGLPAKRVLELLSVAQTWVDAGQVDGIRFSTRPDTIDERRMDLLTQYAVTTVELGVQSLNDRVLKMSRRGHGAGDTRRALAVLRRRGYQVGVQLMVGLPGDDEKSILACSQQLAALKPSFARIYPTIVLRGSPLAAWFRSGRYTPLTLSQAVDICKRLLLKLLANHIPVVRLGLQASQSLDGTDAVVAGPYHPAFGHLVYAAVMLEKAVSQLDACDVRAKSISLRVHPCSISRMQGINKQNLTIIGQKYQARTVQIIPDPAVSNGAVKVHVF